MPGSRGQAARRRCDGVNNLDDFMKKVDVLRHSARYVMKPPRLDPELRWRDPAPNWVTVFVHVCEVGGLCRQWSSDRIEAVCQRASAADAVDICRFTKDHLVVDEGATQFGHNRASEGHGVSGRQYRRAGQQHQ